MKSKVLIYAAVQLAAAYMLCACSLSPSLEQEYSYTEREPLRQEAIEVTAKPFAADLCVVMDEGLYTDSSVSSEAAAVFNVDDASVIYSKNAFDRLYPASITKVMTALLAIKYGTLTDMVTVTQDAVITESGATLCGIKPGDQLTLNDLLYGLMLPSGNDAGCAIAVHMAGSLDAFNDMMNKEAKSLGATGTNFMNSHGLTDEQHYTTAYDLYLIFQEAMKYPKFREVVNALEYTAEYTNQAGEAVSSTWSCGNWFMIGKKDTPQGLTVIGGKTGTTSAAGYCLIMAEQDTEGKEYISVVLKAGSRNGLYDNMSNIISKIVD